MFQETKSYDDENNFVVGAGEFDDWILFVCFVNYCICHQSIEHVGQLNSNPFASNGWSNIVAILFAICFIHSISFTKGFTREEMALQTSFMMMKMSQLEWNPIVAKSKNTNAICVASATQSPCWNFFSRTEPFFGWKNSIWRLIVPLILLTQHRCPWKKPIWPYWWCVLIGLRCNQFLLFCSVPFR